MTIHSYRPDKVFLALLPGLGFNPVYVRSRKRYFKHKDGIHIRIDFDEYLIAVIDQSGWTVFEEKTIKLSSLQGYLKPKSNEIDI